MPSSTHNSVFDLNFLEEQFEKPGLINERVKYRLIRDAFKLPLREARAKHDIAFWKQVCPLLTNKAAKALVDLDVKIYTLENEVIYESQNNDTTKLLLNVTEDQDIECCIIRFAVNGSDHKFVKMGRSTVCVSTQVGCAMACTFCATGTLGLKANLTAGMIAEQFVLAHHIELERGNADGIRNVVIMGMGEPLDNYENLVAAVRVMLLLNVAAFRITVSTVGFSPEKIRQLAVDLPDVSLALSLHAPTQELREQIVLSSRNVDFEEMLEAAFFFVAQQRRKGKKYFRRQFLFIEYCLIAEVNDSDEVAHQLGHLLKNYSDVVVINVIPYNKTEVSHDYKTPSVERIESFRNILVQDHNLTVYIRGVHGSNINSACGQLSLAQKRKGSKSVKTHSDTICVAKEVEQNPLSCVLDFVWTRVKSIFLASASLVYYVIRYPINQMVRLTLYVKVHGWSGLILSYTECLRLCKGPSRLLLKNS